MIVEEEALVEILLVKHGFAIYLEVQKAFALHNKFLLLMLVSGCQDGFILVFEVLLLRINHPQYLNDVVIETMRVDVEVTEGLQIIEHLLQIIPLNDPHLKAFQVNHVYSVLACLML